MRVMLWKSLITGGIVATLLIVAFQLINARAVSTEYGIEAKVNWAICDISPNGKSGRLDIIIPLPFTVPVPVPVS